MPIQVSVDGLPLGAAITPSGTAFSSYTTSAFTVAAGNRVLRFATSRPDDSAISLIDDISIEATEAPVALPLPAAPPMPTNLAATFVGDQVTLRWQSVGNHPTYGAPSYKIKRAPAPDGPTRC